ncbi:putative ribonuclease H-like domain-containing protein [Tanacetum coccineum]
MNIVSGPQYVLLPFLTSDSQGPKSSKDAVTDNAGKKTNEEPANKGERNGQEKEGGASNKENDQNVQDFRVELDNLLVQQKEGYANITNRDSTVSPSISTAGQNLTNADDQERIDNSTQDVNTAGPTTGIFDDAYDDREEVGAEADLNNLKTTMNVSHIPTTRIYKDHPKDQIIGDINSATQTRRMTKIFEEHAMVIQALTDPSWIEVMQEELLQFKLQKVWTLVDFLKAKELLELKGIDYDKVFAPVAMIKAIRLFLAYASFTGLIVYQMDVKSAFLYGTVEQEVEKALYDLHEAPRAWYETLRTYLLENGYRIGSIDKTLFIKKDRGDILLVQVYVDDIIFRSIKKFLCVEFEPMMHKRFQMSFMGELTFFLGLQVQQKEDGIFISQDKYVADILKKFDFTTVKVASTPIETNKALNKDKEANDVDVHLYRSKVDIMFVICACARFQVTPKTSHLHAVKRIFRYSKIQPKLGLWYPRDSLFDLEAFLIVIMLELALIGNP